MILQNAILIMENNLEDDFLVSSHVHDFQEYIFKNGDTVYVDGGRDYIRRGGSVIQNNVDYGKTWMEWCLTDDEPFYTIKSKLLWGTRGKDGKQPFKYVRLLNCDTNHLKMILKTQQISPIYESVIKSILKDRQPQS